MDQNGKTAGPSRTYPVLRLAMVVVVGLLTCNIAIDLTLRAAGLIESTNSAIPLGDPFSDYFRFVISYPSGEHVGSVVPRLAAQLRDYQATNPPSGADALMTGKLTHFNAPPINTLFALLNLRAMHWIDPALLYISVCLAMIGYWVAIVGRYVPAKAEWADWVVLGLLSYPMLMTIVRGNIFAGMTGLLIVHALLLRRQETAPRFSALLLAIAIGMRPNAVVFAVPLLALRHSERRTIMVTLAVAIPAVSGIAMVAAHALYPDYGVATFLAGLRSYHHNQVGAAWGVAHGSSLYGALAVVFGSHPWLEIAALLPAGAIGLSAILLRATGRLDDVAYLFLIAAAYCLGTTIIADYHLFVFMLPIMAAALAKNSSATRSCGVALTTACLMLAPKNYLYHGDISIQPVLNPLLLLTASSIIVVMTVANRSGVSQRAFT